MQDIEFLKKIVSLGDTDITKIFVNESPQQLNHIMDNYERCRYNDGQYGNYSFIFSLSEDYANMVIGYVKGK